MSSRCIAKTGVAPAAPLANNAGINCLYLCLEAIRMVRQAIVTAADVTTSNKMFLILQEQNAAAAAQVAINTNNQWRQPTVTPHTVQWINGNVQAAFSANLAAAQQSAAYTPMPNAAAALAKVDND